MRKVMFLVLLLTLSVLIPSVLAQDAATAELIETLVLPRLEAYNADLPEGYGTLKVEDFVALLAEEDVTILDVRETAEVEEFGTIEGAVHVPLRTLGENLALLPDLDATVVVVCKGGFRATIAMTALHVLGYENARVLVGGFDAWVGEELPVVDAPAEVEAAEIPEDIDPALLEYVAAYLADLPEGWGAIKAADLNTELIDNPPDFLLDVRSDKEWTDPGYIEGAQHLWIDEFMTRMDEWPEDRDASIVVYCGSSYRAGVAGFMLGLMGYSDVRNLSGGINAWLAAELPVVQPS